MPAYVVATIRPWNISKYYSKIRHIPGEWCLVNEPSKLTIEFLREINPRYVFFPHWSDKVPREVTEQFECVCFHETDLPYGRGGSPIQNLIQRGHRETAITAFRMTECVDAGPVYIKRNISLEGLAEEIYLRVSDLVAEMITYIVMNEPKPLPQDGEVVCWERRKPCQSQINDDICSLEHLFDLIRMLDADGYPHAYLNIGMFRIHFRRPALRTDHIEADVTISIKKD